MGSGFVLKKLNAARNVRGHRTLAVDGVPIPLGLSHSETTPTTEVEAVTTNGESRHTPTSDQASSIASAFQETEGSSQCQGTRSSCTGWSGAGNGSPSWTSYFRDDTDNRGGGCRYAWKIEFREVYGVSPVCRVCFKETEGSSSAKVPAQVAVDGLQARILPGLYPFEMIPIIEVEAVLIIGIWTAPSHVAPSIVHLTPHALVEGYSRFHSNVKVL
ncbi:hypothetical protein OS493_007860 [Desmophyllum pertusum]|uniref:Uncharacterized protein n=1 Tax=Desmophyllum pertusum TaxID=174260 RepID=A0A9W9YS51_9CNID|nr:hypothetical protein OS493_007860 [Desmophyllum pertusum]